jgi:8-oxo-dGTP diphosphatase
LKPRSLSPLGVGDHPDLQRLRGRGAPEPAEPAASSATPTTRTTTFFIDSSAKFTTVKRKPRDAAYHSYPRDRRSRAPDPARRLQAAALAPGLPPFAGDGRCPGAARARDLRALDPAPPRAKVDVRELSHLEQLETRADPRTGLVTTAYLGLIRSGVDPAVPDDTEWHPVDTLPPTAFDHGSLAHAARERLRAKLSYTNLGFALAPETFTVSELRDLYAAALGHEVSATNLQRVLIRRGVLEPTGERRPSGAAAADRPRCSASGRPTSRSPTSSPCCDRPSPRPVSRGAGRRSPAPRPRAPLSPGKGGRSPRARPSRARGATASRTDAAAAGRSPARGAR